MKENKTYYIVTYRDPKDGKIVECKAKSIRDSNLGLSFISISDFLFNTSSVVVDPNEEYLQEKFSNVKSLHLCIYSVISIAEVGMENLGLSFKNDKSNLLVLNPTDSPTTPSNPT